MDSFRVIPVVDILKSKVVHAVKGERNNYNPLISELFNTPNPIDVIESLIMKYGFNEIYIADLDSILKKVPNLELLSTICERFPKIKIILDPGITNLKEIYLFSRIKLNKLILGMETIENLKVIEGALTALGKDHIIISIDMYNGKMLTKNKKLIKKNPLDISSEMERLGVKEIIILDLFRIGQKIGGIPEIYMKIRETFEGNVLAGGGTKNLEDLLLYSQNKFSGVLIGTSLYDGTIKIEEIKKLINKNLTC